MGVQNEVKGERERQDNKWGNQNHPPEWWIVILTEELGEACEALLATDLISYRNEMVQIAAVAMAAIESLDRNSSLTPAAPDVTIARAEAAEAEFKKLYAAWSTLDSACAETGANAKNTPEQQAEHIRQLEAKNEKLCGRNRVWEALAALHEVYYLDREKIPARLGELMEAYDEMLD